MRRISFQIGKMSAAGWINERMARLLADVVVLCHAAYVTFVIVGLLVTLYGGWAGWYWVRNFWFRMIHLAMISIVVVESIIGITCPLTVWEAALRRRAGETVQSGAFIARWAHELMFFDAPTWVFTTAYCVFGLLVVVAFILIPPTRPRWLGKVKKRARDERSDNERNESGPC
jgi:hypothetical protein